MRLYNRYLVTLGLLFTATTVTLAVLSQHQLELYFSAFLIEYLAATLLFAYLHPQALRLLRFMGHILFGGFLLVIAIKALEILVTLTLV